MPEKGRPGAKVDLGSLRKTMRTHITSIVLAAVLTAASLLAPFARATDYLMPKVNGVWPFDPNPAAPGSLTNQFMTYGEDPHQRLIPVKSLRITNNTKHTVYPVLRVPNSTLQAKPYADKGLYDPYDPVNKEYRGYIGYEKDGNYYFGLKPGQSIKVTVPLVFWDGGRIAIGTDGTYLTASGTVNPENWDPNSQRSIANAETSNDTIPNGVVMWYRAEVSNGPTDDVRDQLAEWTIRDHDYLSNPQITKDTHGQIALGQLVTLTNYDVSYVDSLYLPLAFEANDAWVVPQIGPVGNDRNNWTAGSDPDVFGWTGATSTNVELETKIAAFTSPNYQFLGHYFNQEQGWPAFNFPIPTFAPINEPIKIPSGANIFPNSPLLGTLWAYNDGVHWQLNKYMLSSGGTAPISATIPWAGGKPDPTGSTILHLLVAGQSELLAFVQKGDIVTGNPAVGKSNPIQPGTTVTKVVDRTEGTVELSLPLVHSSSDCSYSFTRPVDDYAAGAMITLWFSWAQYYLEHWKDGNPNAHTDPTTIMGSIAAYTATMTFKDAHPELVKGMAVTGPGLDDAQTEVGRHQGDAVILYIAPDNKSVILSQVPATGSKDVPFTFLPPEKNRLIWTPTANQYPGYPYPYQFKFSDEKPWHDPYDFSQQVYLIMASMNQIGKPNNNTACKYMQDIIGGNMGFIFTDKATSFADTQMVIATIRDMIKSVLRGVTDFTQFPDEIINGERTWYPNPAEKHGGQLFNVFNLDPYVYFVHVVLGFSGYGFSLDDDTSDIGAGGASHLQLSVTNTGGLINTNPWVIQAPYGPVKNMMLSYSGPGATNGDTIHANLKSVSNTTPIKVTTEEPHNLSNNDTVRIDSVNGDPAANGTFIIENVTTDTFELYQYVAPKTPGAPVAPTGNYTGGGRWSYPLHAYIDTGADLAKVFYRVKGDDPDGLFLGTFVSVNNVEKNPTNPKAVMFRVWMLGQANTGRLLLWDDLTDKNGMKLEKGTYKFTFFGPGQEP